MPSLLPILTCLLTGLSTSGPVLWPAPPTLPARSFVLDNGLRVVLHEDHRQPEIALSLRVGVGSAEDGARPGLAHLVEHLMFEGGEGAVGDYDKILEAAGGESNAHTRWDETIYEVQAPANALDIVLWLEAARLAPRSVSRGSLANQQDVVLAERADAAGRPGGLAAEVRSAVLFPAPHPYHAAVGGGSDAIMGISAAEVASFHDRWVVPANATLSLAGDFSLDEAEAAVRRWLGPVAARPVPEPVSAQPPNPPGEERFLWLTDAYTPSLSAMWVTGPRGDPDEAALDMLAWLLAEDVQASLSAGGGRYTARAWTENARLAGTLTVELRANPRSDGRLPRRALKIAESALDEKLAALAASGPSPEALARQQRRYAADLLRAAEPLDSRAELLGRCLAWTGGTDCLAVESAARLAVTTQDVQRVAAGLGARTLLYSVPESRADALLLPGMTGRVETR